MKNESTVHPKRITTTDAPMPLGHYSQAMLHKGILYVSGQLPIQPDGRHLVDVAFEAQVNQVLANLLAIVIAAGSSEEDILKVTAYIVGVENWPLFNDIFAAHLGTACPARAVVPVPTLHHGYLIELDAIAACPASK